MKLHPRKHVALALALACTAAWFPITASAQQTGGFRRSTGTSANNYPSATQLGGATVSYDPETRKLIVVTDEETAQHIGQVVTNLARPAPQVLIKVVFVEVTYRKGLDIGLEGNTAQLFGGNNANTGLVNHAFGLAAAGTSPAPPGAGLYQILGSDFQVTLRAIAQAGKSEILSRPSVLARNNQQAYITVGQNVPIVGGINYDSLGNQRTTVSYRDVGIILQVTPFITSSGMVEMVVSPEISSLSEETVAFGDGIEIPIINTRTADTVVITPDGQTVVIGGLMQKTKAETDSKIPVLGDIPLLGNLFKRKERSDTKTELLIFLTPHILRDPVELASMTSYERGKSQIIPKSYSEELLNQYLDALPTKDGAAPATTSKKPKKSK